MSEQKQRMLSGELYQDDSELSADRRRCQSLLNRFNATLPGQDSVRAALLAELFDDVGERSWIVPPLRCDYGYLIRIGSNSFINHDATLQDCGPITIGDDVSIGPHVQLLTALHPMDDHELRRQRWETAAPISIDDNVWLGGGVIVCAGVSIGANTVVGAGSVVTRTIPERVFAAGNPCRVIRPL